MKTCADCKFFEQVDPTQGTCHRLPPVPFPTAPEQVTSFWPSVQPTQWCGEHAIRLEIARVLPSDPRKLKQ